MFDKATGASVLGPVGIATLWSGFGGVCENNGDGDPVVLYDQLANRWIVSQFAGHGVPTDECVAVSTTGTRRGRTTGTTSTSDRVRATSTTTRSSACGRTRTT